MIPHVNQSRREMQSKLGFYSVISSKTDNEQ